MVRGVALQYGTGLYLFGRPGTAKTHIIRQLLEQDIREPYVYKRGHITPLGLFELIAQHPDDVIVLDDLAAMFKSDIACQILLSALDQPSGSDRDRVVIYQRRVKPFVQTSVAVSSASPIRNCMMMYFSWRSKAVSTASTTTHPTPSLGR